MKCFRAASIDSQLGPGPAELRGSYDGFFLFSRKIVFSRNHAILSQVIRLFNEGGEGCGV